MFKALVGGFAELFRKPVNLLPALVAMAINFTVLILTIESYFDFFYEVFIFNEVPESSLVNLPFYLFSTYLFEITVMAMGAFISMALGFYLLYVYSAILTGKETGAIKAMSATLAKLPEIAGLTAFVFVAAILYSVIGFALLAASITLDGIGIVVFLLWVAWIMAGIYVYLKFSFTPVFMASDKLKLKAALTASWKWSEKKLLPIAVLLIVLSFMTGLINAAATAIAEGSTLEIIAFPALVLGLAFSNAYFSITIIKYFMASKQ